MRYRKGQTLYACSTNTDTGKVTMDEYIVTCVRGGNVFATCFIRGYTWVKRSKTHGDFGWASHIPKSLRYDFAIDSKNPPLFTTKLKAYHDEFRCLREEWLVDKEDPLYSKIEACLLRMTKMRRRNK